MLQLRVGNSDVSTRFWEYVTPVGKCWEWRRALNQDGYGVVCVRNLYWRVHRLAWVLIHGPIPHGMYVCHHCDNRRCVKPGHLFLGSAKDNGADMSRKGRGRRRTGTR